MTAHHPGATYLLSNGRVIADAQPTCFQTRATHSETPLTPGTDGDGLWAEIIGEDQHDLDAIRVVAWLSSDGEAQLRAANTLHAFRRAIRTHYPDAQIMRYRRRDEKVLREQVIILENE